MRVINIEGIDAVGKETVSKALEEELRGRGFCVTRVSFPNYEGSIGKAIKDILMGACGGAPSLSPELLGPFYTIDRLSYFKCEIDRLLDRYDYVIMDRSFYSNLMYQAAKYYISGKKKDIPREFLYDDVQIDKFGMSLETLTTIYDWVSQNYQWEIMETGLYRCDNMFTFVLTLSEEDSKKQLSNRAEIDTNESSRYYLEGCKEFISILLNDKYRYNIKKFIETYIVNRYPGYSLNEYISNIYNAAYYYLDNVEQVEVMHVDNPDDIPAATRVTVGKIIELLNDNDMFDGEGDDTNG